MTADAAPRLSLVVPVYNEAGSLDELHAELASVLGAMGEPWEVVYVDDGSTDASARLLAAIADRDPHARVLTMPRNMGKSAAYTAAFAAVRGEVVFTLDADLQDDPHEIPQLLARVREGWDLVVGWKQHRLENEPLKALPSRVFNGLGTRLFGLSLHDANCGYRAMRVDVARRLVLYGDLYRFIPQLTHVAGFRVCEAPVNHRKRRHGLSKYGPRRFWTGLLDLLTVRFITRYAERPLHFFGTVGLAPTLLGLGLEGYVLVQKAMGSTFQTHVAAIVIGVLLLVMGFQCVVTGLIGEMLTAQGHGRARSELP